MGEFETAAEAAKGLKGVSNDKMLEMYGLFKQGTVGDCNIDKPTGLLDMKGKAKWEAWNALKGLSQDDAKVKYIALVAEFQK